jgi:hypothetical protein
MEVGEGYHHGAEHGLKFTLTWGNDGPRFGLEKREGSHCNVAEHGLKFSYAQRNDRPGLILDCHLAEHRLKFPYGWGTHCPRSGLEKEWGRASKSDRAWPKICHCNVTEHGLKFPHGWGNNGPRFGLDSHVAEHEFKNMHLKIQYCVILHCFLAKRRGGAT